MDRLLKFGDWDWLDPTAGVETTVEVGSTSGWGSGSASITGIGMGLSKPVVLLSSIEDEGALVASSWEAAAGSSSDLKGSPQPDKTSSSTNDQPSNASLPRHLAFNIVTSPRHHSGPPHISLYYAVRPGIKKVDLRCQNCQIDWSSFPPEPSFSLGQQAGILGSMVNGNN